MPLPGEDRTISQSDIAQDGRTRMIGVTDDQTAIQHRGAAGIGVDAVERQPAGAALRHTAFAFDAAIEAGVEALIDGQRSVAERDRSAETRKRCGCQVEAVEVEAAAVEPVVHVVRQSACNASTQRAGFHQRAAEIAVGRIQRQSTVAALGQAALAADRAVRRHVGAGIHDVDDARTIKLHFAVEAGHRGAGDAQTAIGKTQIRIAAAQGRVLVHDQRAAIRHQRFTDKGMVVDAVVLHGLCETPIRAAAIKQRFLFVQREVGEDRVAVFIRDLAEVEVFAHVVARQEELLVAPFEVIRAFAPNKTGLGSRTVGIGFELWADPAELVGDRIVIGNWAAWSLVGIKIAQRAERLVRGIIGDDEPFAERTGSEEVVDLHAIPARPDISRRIFAC